MCCDCRSALTGTPTHTHTSELRTGFDASRFVWDAVRASDADPLHTPDARESYAAMLLRAERFLHDTLLTLPPGPVVVVSHSAFLLGLVNAALLCPDAKLLLPFRTAEVRAFALRTGD